MRFLRRSRHDPKLPVAYGTLDREWQERLRPAVDFYLRTMQLPPDDTSKIMVLLPHAGGRQATIFGYTDRWDPEAPFPL